MVDECENNYMLDFSNSKIILAKQLKSLDSKFTELKNKLKNNIQISNKNNLSKILSPKYIIIEGKEEFMGARINFNLLNKRNKKSKKEEENNLYFEKNNKMKEKGNNILKEDFFENNKNVQEEENNIIKVGGENTKIIIIQPNESLLKKKRGPFTIINSSSRKYKKIL